MPSERQGMETLHNPIHIKPQSVLGVGRQFKGPQSIFRINVTHQKLIPRARGNSQIV